MERRAQQPGLLVLILHRVRESSLLGKRALYIILSGQNEQKYSTCFGLFLHYNDPYLLIQIFKLK